MAIGMASAKATADVKTVPVRACSTPYLSKTGSQSVWRNTAMPSRSIIG
jgi:hypothetical protein